ncbi:family 10 glycosylhydrolase [Trichormus variabilis ARAD]|nr:MULTISPECIES: family 10 glycosylhydrolase [Nostocaceae]MBC1216621.1 family 10 glycosylhydrolase [Trichormus variabilis ARAD]MBC1257426.1 family 10 glycosylhydrolase [Trichormus variabilis V5]MBC1269842.1 family 10 glycosylhydrolase [Trichormus variabilis FSR]MBC1304356.1 family 10 glycosylhydrolase [Trichormus variabilis N2B]MBC1312920.1 family 10 glycosylhydrolase [Trichormus variabilis PNB]
MSNRPLNHVRIRLLYRQLVTAIFTSSLLLPYLGIEPVQAQVTEFCQISSTAAQTKEKLRLSALKGNQDARKRYQGLIKQQAQELQKCRSRTWPNIQAVWLRLYPCDMKPGAIDQIMDRMVNRGYNEVYLEVFYDGRVLLPASANPTVWPSVIRTKGAEKVDLLATAIQKGRQRGLKVYGWLYTNNFGYNYALRRDREGAIARNGKGQTSLYVVDNGSQVFIDPYNEQAKRDYYRMVQEIVRRRPDGLLFDYVRYPRQAGSNSIATKVADLWLYTEATQAALFRRAQNKKGLELIRRFLSQGYVTPADINDVDQLYPQEGEPMWQGRIVPPQQKSLMTPTARQPILQMDLWLLAIAHSMQGIIDFVSLATHPAKQINIPTGVVFFPDGNQTVGQGYDSRLQPWDKFPNSLQWHPMSYATCGNVNCIVEQVQRVLSMAQPGTKIIPALAGNWGESVSNRPPLEVQMQALRPFASKLKGVSHFAYSWQYPEHDSDRKSCRN